MYDVRSLVLVLHNIRSCYNVGAILRTAEGCGVSKIILSGYTPRIHDESLLPHLREKLDNEIHKTALGAEELLDIESVDDIKEVLSAYKEVGYKIMGLENNIEEETVKLNELVLERRMVLILGEEVHGIPEDLYEYIDTFVEIPMMGRKESFNVSVAAGIALYDIMVA